MNKILIVGHPQSGFHGVERLLRARGMARPLPSRREGFLPDQLDQVLCQAHRAPALDRLGKDCAVQQIGTGPLWQSLAMDLMLGNLEQPLWGWSDPQAIHLLDYWRETDPNLHFILVYERPESALMRTSWNEAARLTHDELQRRLDGWTAFNARLLEFHIHHQQRSLLVQGTQVQLNAESTLRHVRARIDAAWVDRAPVTTAHRAGERPLGQDLQAVEDATGIALDNETDGPSSPEAIALVRIVARTLVQQQKGSVALYEELQANADLPLTPDGDATTDAKDGLQAWQVLVASHERQQYLRQLVRQLQSGREEARSLAQSHERLLAQERSVRSVERKDNEQQVADIRRALKEVRKSQLEAQAENGRLLEQIHEVQCALEQQHRAAEENAMQAGSLMAREREALAAAEQARAASQQARDEAALLKDRLDQLQQAYEALQAQANAPRPSPELGSQNERLWQQLLEVQDALGRYHQENQQLKTGSTPSAMHAPVWFGAANRVRSELSYRLGARMVQLGRHPLGWLMLPWVLALEKRRFLRDQSSCSAHELPPIESYRDAHEAERVRQHLSYRLGLAYLSHTRRVADWLQLPGALRRELKSHHDRVGH